ncbi:transposase (fragment) [Xenorhabdus doucetiae]|uniref:Transposase n=1 Tax=Xenorhabdus doucetiae TaxID=351671 RepID=A0A068QM11_9GAMM
MLAIMKIHLTPEQKRALELMHDTTRDSRVCDRIKGVAFGGQRGGPLQMIGRAFRFS